MITVGVLRRVVVDQGRIDRDEDLAGTHRVPYCHSNVDDLARHLGDDEMLHLHGLEHGEGLPRANTVAGDDFKRDDGGLHRRHDIHSGHGHGGVLVAVGVGVGSGPATGPPGGGAKAAACVAGERQLHSAEAAACVAGERRRRCGSGGGRRAERHPRIQGQRAD